MELYARTHWLLWLALQFAMPSSAFADKPACLTPSEARKYGCSPYGDPRADALCKTTYGSGTLRKAYSSCDQRFDGEYFLQRGFDAFRRGRWDGIPKSLLLRLGMQSEDGRCRITPRSGNFCSYYFSINNGGWYGSGCIRPGYPEWTSSLTPRQIVLRAYRNALDEGRCSSEWVTDEWLASKKAEDLKKSFLPSSEPLNQAFKSSKGIQTLTYRPEAVDYPHAIYYYVPHLAKKEVPVLFYLHGGGTHSYCERDSRDSARSNVSSLKAFAEREGAIVVAPASPDGMAWGFYTPFVIRELVSRMKSALPQKKLSFYLSGFSMGAMGITRFGKNLTDVMDGLAIFSGSPLDDAFQQPQNFYPWLNVPVRHVVGDGDGFTFMWKNGDRTNSLMEKLSRSTGIQGDYHFEVLNAGHSLRVPSGTDTVDRVLTDLIHKPLRRAADHFFAYFNQVRSFPLPVPFTARSTRYEWLEISEFSSVYAEAMVEGQVNSDSISLKTSEIQNLKRVRVHFGQLPNRWNPRSVSVNGKSVRVPARPSNATASILELEVAGGTQLKAKWVHAARPPSGKSTDWLSIRLREIWDVPQF